MYMYEKDFLIARMPQMVVAMASTWLRIYAEKDS